jgi:putative salt-induced outer membrane protein YdiY
LLMIDAWAEPTANMPDRARPMTGNTHQPHGATREFFMAFERLENYEKPNDRDVERYDRLRGRLSMTRTTVKYGSVYWSQESFHSDITVNQRIRRRYRPKR